MKLHKVWRSVAGALLISTAIAVAPACAAPAGRVYVRVGPPASIVERRIVAPSAAHIWLPGFYRWDGRAYIWVPGRWELPPRARAAWVPGHWVHSRHGWYFVDGHWR
jgi:WXXGXW repeat (2 copies)